MVSALQTELRSKADGAAGDHATVVCLKERVKSLERQNSMMLLMMTGDKTTAASVIQKQLTDPD
jgi:hypothetical protein